MITITPEAKEKLLLLADTIETHTEFPFDMQYHETCIVAYAQYLQKGIKPYYHSQFHCGWWGSRELFQWLGLLNAASMHERIRVIAPEDDLAKITRKQAVKMLRHLADTGVVNWELR